MEMQSKKKITWTIKNFSSLLQGEKIYSDKFVVGGCKWRLCTYPKGNNVDYLFMFLEVAEFESLPSGWRRHVRYLLSLVNHNSIKRSRQTETQKWFDGEALRWGHLSMFLLNEICVKDSGFLVNGELKIVAEVEVLEVIGKLDVPKEASTITETIDVNGFQLLSSLAESASRMFERHPEMASEFLSRNPYLRTGYISLLLNLIESLHQSPNELSKADLVEAYAALGSIADAGFKLEWLEKKLCEMLAKKEKEEAEILRMQEMEQELKGLKQKCSDLEAQIAKDRSKDFSYYRFQ